MGEQVRAGGIDLWVERQGKGPDVLLIAGLGSPPSTRRRSPSRTKQSTEAMQRSIDAFLAHDTGDRIHNITAKTLVLAGGLDLVTPPRFGRAVAEGIPGARFEVLAEEAHQPFQEVPDQFNARVDDFWREVGAQD
jgi:pimeloyl-ACP methyl ester carboxylesterase